MTTKIGESRHKSKLAGQNSPSTALCDANFKTQFPHLFFSLQFPEIAQQLEALVAQPFEYDKMLEEMLLDFQRFQFGDEDSVRHIQRNGELRNFFQAIYRLNTYNQYQEQKVNGFVDLKTMDYEDQ